MSATSTSALSSTLAGAFMAGQLVACTVTASDGKSGTDTDTGSVTIGNTAPVVSSVTLSPSTVYTSDTLTATVVSSDADGDSLTTSYAWYVGGSLVSATSSTLSGASYFSKGQEVYVTATANDGTTSTALSSSAITVSNTAPSAPVVEITPVAAESGDDLTCSVTTASTDVDGDALTYAFAWDVNGVDYTSATDAATSSVVDGADVGGEEVWTCEVVAGDGTSSGTAGSDSVTTGIACDSYSYGSSTYEFCMYDARPWSDAEDVCEAMGGTLVVINTAAEWWFVNDTLAGVYRTVPWIGYSDNVSEGTWEWVNGESGYADWQSGEPGCCGGGDEDCADFNWDGAQGYRDADCSIVHPYICET